MPPRKRKATEEEPSESKSDNSVVSGAPTPAKKAKKTTAEMKAELRERARLAIAGAKTPASKGTTTTASSSSSARPSRKSLSSSAAKTPTKRSRKTTRKSTGGISERVGAMSGTETETEDEVEETKKKTPAFKFSPLEPTAEEVEVGPGGTPNHNADEEYRAGAIASSTPARKPFLFGPEEGREIDLEKDERKEASSAAASPSTAKKLAKQKAREEARAHALKYKMQLDKKHAGEENKFAYTPLSMKKAAPSPEKKAASPDKMETDQEEEEDDGKPSKVARMKSPDPPESRAAASSVAVSAAASITRTSTKPYPSPTLKPSVAATAKSTRPKSTKKPHPTPTNPALAAIFSPKTQSTAHRPGLAAHAKSGTPTKFDPTKPWPSTGYKLPTAAYCGCGPTPFSRNQNSRMSGSSGPGLLTNADLCVTDGSTQSQYSANMQRIMQNIPPVDPPHRSFSPDELKPAGAAVGSEMTSGAACGLGGKNEGGEKEKNGGIEPVGMDIGDHAVRNATITTTTTTVATSVATAASHPVRNAVDPPVPSARVATAAPTASKPASVPALSKNPAATDPDVLKSFSKATALLAATRKANDERRKMMGIGAQKIPENVADNNSIPTQDIRDQKMPEDPPIDTDRASTVASVDDDVKRGKISFIEDKKSEEKVIGENKPSETREDGEIEEVAPRRKTRSFGAKLVQFGLLGILLCVVSGLCFVFFHDGKSVSLFHSENGQSSEDALESPPDIEVLCFIDHPSDFYSSGEDLHEDDICNGEFKKCPRRGRCHGGRLRDCSDGGGEKYGFSLFVPNERGDACVKSPEALDYVRRVESALIKLTSADVCRSWSIEDYEYPTFGIGAVAEEVSNDLGLGDENSLSSEFFMWLQPVFEPSTVVFEAVHAANIEVIGVMGLGPGVPPADLALPLPCLVKFAAIELTGLSLVAIYNIFISLLKCIWNFIISHPYTSAGFLVTAYIINAFRKRYQRMRKVRALVATVLEAVYDRLSESDDCEAYPVLILRDDVGHEMYPLNIRERHFMFDEVWPLVVRQLNADNRVKKSQQVANGKNLLHWELATQSKKARKMRKSLGSSNDVKNGNVKEESPVKRDP